MDLFEAASQGSRRGVAPLADRMRPRDLLEFVGQAHLLAPGRVLRRLLETGELHSMILWGPPGSGKTTLAQLLAAQAHAHVIAFSAVLSGVKEIRKVIEEADDQLKCYQRRTVLFVDEIHRFNRAQQDAFLPHVERGTLILIGATTENPSFEVISALLSRCRVYVLHRLGEPEVLLILERALADRGRGLGELGAEVEPEALALLARLADGDARAALSGLEVAVMLAKPVDGIRRVTLLLVQEALQRKALLYDKSGEEHYNLISALHKSLRDSDPDASLYWLARMLAAGEDPLYIARRLIRFASEDVGNADPQALTLALGAKEAYNFLGSPEGELALAQAAVYLACAPKSNAVTTAFAEAQRDVEERPAEPVPLHLRNAPTPLMRELGYGKDYRYAHDSPNALVSQEDLPEGLRGRTYYHPTGRGFEAEIQARLDRWRHWKAGHRGTG